MIACILALLVSGTGAQDAPRRNLENGLPRSKEGTAFFLSPDGKKIVVTGLMLADGEWGIWNVQNKQRALVGDMKTVGAHSAVLIENRKELVVGGDCLFVAGRPMAELRIIDAENGKSLKALDGHRASITQLGLTPDAKYLISLADGDCTIRVWTLAKRKPFAKYCFTSNQKDLNRWQEFADAAHERPKIVTIHKDAINRLYAFAVNNKGHLLAVTTGTRAVFLMETLTGKVVRRIRCKEIDCSVSVAFSSDGTLLAIGGGGDAAVIEIWDLKKDRLVRVLRRHLFTVYSLAISPNNELVASGGVQDGVRVWDLKSGRQKYQLHRNQGDDWSTVKSLAFMPDGETLVTLCHGEPVRFWDAATGRAKKSLGEPK